jgi:hypothetical protein
VTISAQPASELPPADDGPLLSVPPESTDARVRSRRTVILGALGGVAGLIAGRLGRPGPAAAAAGSPLIIGSLTNDAGTNDTQLMANSSVVTFKLYQQGPGTALMGYTTTATGTTRGVYGRVDSPNGDGVQARNAGAAGTGAAIRAFGGANLGVVATSDVTGVDGTGATYGVHGHSDSNYGVAGDAGYAGVYGSGPYGTYGSGSSAGAIGSTTAGYGLYGLGPIGAVGIGTGSGYGVWGYNSESGGLGAVGQGGYRGIYGSGGNAGVFGTSGYVGLWGEATTTSGTNYGVYATTASPTSGWAGVFTGRVYVSGNLNKAGGGFKIDHPQDPGGRYLVHSFVEAPEMLNVYSGTAILDGSGSATVDLPGYFQAANADFRYQLTAVGRAAPDLHIAGRVSNNQFGIAGGAPGMQVCWQVTGVRQDAWAKANPMAVEPKKPATEKGRYLHPTLYGKPASAGIHTLPSKAPQHAAPRALDLRA